MPTVYEEGEGRLFYNGVYRILETFSLQLQAAMFFFQSLTFIFIPEINCSTILAASCDGLLGS